MNNITGFKTEIHFLSNDLPPLPISKKVSIPQTTPVHIPFQRQQSNIKNNILINNSYTRSNSYLRDISKDKLHGNSLLNTKSELNDSTALYTNSESMNSNNIKFNNKDGICKMDIFNGFSQEKQLLEEIIEKFDKLHNAIYNELEDGKATENSLKEANHTLENLKTADQEAQNQLLFLTESLEKINKTYKIFTADNLSDTDTLILEDILEKLESGLQTATIALYHKPKEKSTSTNLEDINNQVNSLKSYESFEYLVPLGISSVTGSSPEICSQLISKLQDLRSLQIKNVEKLKFRYLNISQVQKNLTDKINTYKESIEKIRKYEMQLKEKTNFVEQLSGEGNYADLNESSLQDLCRKINKASRKIVTELALRDIRAANAQSFLTINSIDKENCIVCFENKWNTTLSPCGHLLCDECSSRLNYCPQCRIKIESRQRCFQP